MKQTNDKAVIRLPHLPTGKYIDWEVSRNVVPSVHYISQRADKLRDELTAYIDKHGIDLETLKDVEHIANVDKLTAKIINLRLDALSCILDPCDGMPEKYESKREFLEQCIVRTDVINTILNFFFKHSASFTGSQEDLAFQPIQILNQNREPWDPEGSDQNTRE